MLFKYKFETPQHYYSAERYDEARTSLSYFYKNDRLESKVYSFIKREDQNTYTLAQVPKRTHCSAFWVASLVHILQPTSGINGILLQLFDVGNDFDLYYVFVIAIINIAAMIFYFFCLRKMSRKIPLVMGVFIMASC